MSVFFELTNVYELFNNLKASLPSAEFIIVSHCLVSWQSDIFNHAQPQAVRLHPCHPFRLLTRKPTPIFSTDINAPKILYIRCRRLSRTVP